MQDREKLDNKRGLDVALQKKLAAKFDPKKAANCLDWIHKVTKKKVTGDFHEDLKDGFLLCMLLKGIAPDVYKKKKFKSSRTKQPFKCRTQIQNFIAGCKELGMKETDVCTSQDLFEGDNLNAVVNHLYALNAICGGLKGFDGPYLPGATTKFAKENKRNFSEQTLREGRAIVGKQYQGGVKDEHKSDYMDSHGIIKTQAKATSGVVPLLNQAKPNQDTGSSMDSYGIVKTTEKSQSNAVPLLNQAKKEDTKKSGFDAAGIVKIAQSDTV